jgi:peptidoglycan hydrolase CwlO-like protein
MRNLVLIGTLLAAAGSIAVPPAMAQALINDPTAIAQCLCERQRLDTLQQTIDQRRQSYQTGQQSLASLDHELESRRSSMNVEDPAQVDAYKQLLQQRDSAAAALPNHLIPDYNAAVARYNAARSDYDSRCAGESFDQAAYDRVQATLSCPKP